MSIECYYSKCKYHSNKFNLNEGPFCDEDDCKATKKELKKFSKDRERYLEGLRAGRKERRRWKSRRKSISGI